MIRLEHIQYIIDNHSNELLAKLTREGLEVSTTKAIDTLLACDPSEGKKLTDWLVKTYISNGFLWEDVEIGLESKLAEVLGLYQTHFNQIPRDQRNIYLYRSYGELYRLVEPYIVVPSEDTSMGSREIRRRERAKVLEESDVLFRSEECIVAVPLTESAAVWWGRGTKWCTSAAKNNYFDEYNRYAPLIVILINQDMMNTNQDSSRGVEKFQLWISEKNIQFMDSADSMVDKSTTSKYWRFFGPILTGLVSKNSELIKYFPEEHLTVEICKRAIDMDAELIKYIPVSFIDVELCKIAIEQNANLIRFVPKNFITLEFSRFAVGQDGLIIHYIPSEYQTYEMCCLAVEQNARSLSLIPDQHKSTELCKMAIEREMVAFIYLSDKLKTSELCMIAVKTNGLALAYVPHQYKTQEICEIAILNQGETISNVPDEFRTSDLYTKAVNNSWRALEHIPYNCITAELCAIAMEQNVRAIEYIPKEFKTLELCKKAVNVNGTTIGSVPQEYESVELYEQAVLQEPTVLSLVPDYYQTFEMCKLAVQRNSKAAVYVSNKFTNNEKNEIFSLAVESGSNGLYYIPGDYKTIELCKRSVEKDGNTLASVPHDLRTYEICRIAVKQAPESIRYVPNELKAPDFILMIENYVGRNRKELEELKFCLETSLTVKDSNEISKQIGY